MKKTSLLLWGILLIVSVGLNNQIAEASAEKPTMGITVISYYNPFFVALQDGAKEALDEIGGVLLEHDSQQDVARQLNAVESFIAKKVDVILLNGPTFRIADRGSRRQRSVYPGTADPGPHQPA